MRLFVAVLPPEDVIEDIDAFLEVRRSAADFRWSRDLHLTLAFMASVDEWRVDDLTERLASVAERHAPFDAAITGGGAFPDVARAKVLWAGLSTAGPVDALATGARNAAVASGIEVDGQRFRPHLTLARLSPPRDVVKWARLLDSYRSPAWRVESIALVESHLKERRHEVLAELPLGPAGGYSATP